MSAELTVIAAMDRNRVIGRDGNLPWYPFRIQEDLVRFRDLTQGHMVIMGKNTWYSLDKYRPLPKRGNLVLTRDPDWEDEGAMAVHTLDEALYIASLVDDRQPFIMGGADVYRQVIDLPQVKKLELTLIDAEFDGDAYFPEYQSLFPQTLMSRWGSDERFRYQFLTLGRG